MPIYTEWFDADQHIILIRYEGNWTWNEFYKTATDTVHPLLKSTSRTVYLIADYTHTTTMPMNGIMHARNVFKSMPTNWHKMVIVTSHKFIQILVDMFQKMNYQGMGEKISRANSIDDALKMIRTMEKDSTANH